MKWTAFSVIDMPSRLSKNAVILVSLLALTAVFCNMVMFVYIEYLSSYKSTMRYITAQHRMINKDLAEAVVRGDIYTVYTTADAVSSVIPNIDNIVIYDKKGEYIADAKVMRTKMVSSIKNLGVARELKAGGRNVGTAVYYINRIEILEQIIMELSGLITLNLLIVVTGALAGGYIGLRITKPVIELSQHLIDIKAPMHKTLSEIKNNRHRCSFRNKGENVNFEYSASALKNLKRISKRKC